MAKPKIEEKSSTATTFNSHYLDLLKFYEQQIERIHFTYHERQIKSHEKAATSYMSVLEETINILHQKGHLDTKGKEELDNALLNFDAELKKIEQMPARTLTEIAAKDKKSSELVQKINNYCKELHEQHPNVPELAELKKRREEIETTHTQELKQNLHDRDEELAKVTPHLEMLQEKSKESLLKDMDSVIKIVERADTFKLSSQEREQFEQVYQELLDSRVRLNNSTTHESFKESCQKFCVSLNKLEGQIKPLLSAQDYQKFQQEQRTLNAVNLEGMEIKRVSSQRLFQSPNNLSTPRNADLSPNKSQAISSEHNVNNEVNLTDSELQNIAAQNARNIRKQFCTVMQESRDQWKNPDMLEMNKNMSLLITQLEDFDKNTDGLSPDDQNLVDSLREDLIELQQFNNISDIDPDMIFAIEENIILLSNTYKEFNSIKDRFTKLSMPIMEAGKEIVVENTEQQSLGF